MHLTTSGALERRIPTPHSSLVNSQPLTQHRDYEGKTNPILQSKQFHRFPKARYQSTNKKQTPYQLSRIQMRQARIKRLRRQLSPAPEEGVSETEQDTAAYSIGKSQNNPVSMSYFLRVNANDPALTVSSIPMIFRPVVPVGLGGLTSDEARYNAYNHVV